MSLAEEMAIREATELARYVTGELAMHLGPMIVNRVTPQLFDRAEIDALRAVTSASPALTRMVHAASARFERASAEAQYIAELRAERPWLVEVPQIVLARHDPALLDRWDRREPRRIGEARHG